MTALPSSMDAAARAEAIALRCEQARLQGESWSACCPAHDDSTPSLSITPGPDKVLLHCHAGCTVEAILQALSLTKADLFVSSPDQRNGHRRIVATYDYHDAHGVLLYQTVRFDPKDFRPRRPDPVTPGEWIWNLKGIEPVLFHLPDVLAAADAGETIYVVEGEKDAKTVKALGLAATCNPFGAVTGENITRWRPSYTATLQGCHVAILADNDKAGREHADNVSRKLAPVVRSLKVVPGISTQTAGSDVSDWFAAGHTRAELETAVEACALWTADQASFPDTGPTDTPTRKTDVLPYSDTTNALAFVREHGKNLRYCYPWKSWLVWTGRYWERDTSGAVMRLAKQTVKRLARRIEFLEEGPAKALMAHIKSSLGTVKLKALIENAQSEPGIAVQPEALDQDPWLLNCTNGTLDLRTGDLREHNPADLLTKCLAIAYNKDARYPGWSAFLDKILGGSAELIAFIQQAIGYSLTGSTREQCLFILHGPTKTGKSTFLALLRALLGPYGQQADMASFLHKDKQEVRNDLADLAGSRVVCAVESQDGKRLNENLIKQVTGGVDEIKARFLFQEHFTFKPQFKLFLGTNHKPVIRDPDSAIWERIRLVPFIVQIPKAERDKSLEEHLQAELPGILAWAVRGCLAWQKAKELPDTAAVLDATAAYKSEMDVLARFIEDCCTLSPQAQVKAPTLSAAYQAWCRRNSEEPLARGSFIAALETRGYSRKPGAGNQNYWHGLSLNNTEDTRYGTEE